MPGSNIPFSATEYQRRLDKTRASMSASGIDALFITDPSNMAWITGYDGWSFYVHQGVIVQHDQDPIWWGRAQDAKGAQSTVWMADESVTFYAEHFVQSTSCHPMEDLAEKLADLGLSTARIGVELDNYYFSAKAMDTLRVEMPGVSFVDATGLVNWQRAVKSDEEIAFMRKAGQISGNTMANLLDRVEPGLPKNELIAQAYHDAISGVDGAWGDYPAIVPLAASGKDASAPHLTWDGRPFATGEATFFEIAGCYRRYHAPFCRTVFLGDPPQDILDAEKALIDGLEAGLEAARAGNKAADVAHALKGELRKVGIERDGRVGYPTGLSYPPDWGERTISLRENDDTILEPGMTFHFMPGLWTPGWGLEITETILIKESGGAECLVKGAREMRVKR